MDTTSTAWISCIRRINFFASVPVSVNRHITSRLGSNSKTQSGKSRPEKELCYLSKNISIAADVIKPNSKHDVLKRNPAHI